MNNQKPQNLNTCSKPHILLLNLHHDFFKLETRPCLCLLVFKYILPSTFIDKNQITCTSFKSISHHSSTVLTSNDNTNLSKYIFLTYYLRFFSTGDFRNKFFEINMIPTGVYFMLFQVLIGHWLVLLYSFCNTSKSLFYSNMSFTRQGSLNTKRPHLKGIN